MKVRVASGHAMVCNSMVKNLEWWSHGHFYCTYIHESAAFDAILGYDWLMQHNPMKCDWVHKVLQFQDAGPSVTLCGEWGRCEGSFSNQGGYRTISNFRSGSRSGSGDMIFGRW